MWDLLLLVEAADAERTGLLDGDWILELRAEEVQDGALDCTTREPCSDVPVSGLEPPAPLAAVDGLLSGSALPGGRDKAGDDGFSAFSGRGGGDCAPLWLPSAECGRGLPLTSLCDP